MLKRQKDVQGSGDFLIINDCLNAIEENDPSSGNRDAEAVQVDVRNAKSKKPLVDLVYIPHCNHMAG